MPRLDVGERSKRWELSTRDEELFPKLSSKHKKMSNLISKAYDSIDAIYERVAEILDYYGVFGANRAIYRAYAQELWKLRNKYGGKALEFEAEAISFKYWLYGCDDVILIEIGRLFNLEVFKLLEERLKKALEEAKTLKAPSVYRDDLIVDFEYDKEGRLSRVKIVDKVTGDVKEKVFYYDSKGNLIRVEDVS